MKTLLIIFLLVEANILFAQIDKEQLALTVSKADAANLEKLKAYIWKRQSIATVSGVKKASVITEFSFDETGKIKTTVIDAQSDIEAKRGIRGNMQQQAIEENMDYIEKALTLAISYTYMSKGELLDVFEKSTITDLGTTLEIKAENTLVQGDKLTFVVDKATNLFLSKKFSSLLGKDPISGEMQYETFSTGISHVSSTVLDLPTKNTRIDAKNQDYSQRIK